MAIEALDEIYKLFEVSTKYKIPKTSIRDHLVGRSTGRKMDPRTVLSNDEKQKLCHYISLMVEWGHLMTPLQLKNKVAEITQERIIPFMNGILGNSWIKWFKLRHPELVLKVPQGLDQRRAKALNIDNVARSYSNLE